jgi:hypothetical protein
MHENKVNLLTLTLSSDNNVVAKTELLVHAIYSAGGT